MSDGIADDAELLRKLTSSLQEGDRLLLDLVRGADIHVAGPACSSLSAKALTHGVAPWLYRRLVKAKIAMPDSLRADLHHAFLKAAAHSNAFFYHLPNILAALHREQIPFIVLKGAHLASVFYETPSLRPMRDVDLLVHPGDLAGAQESLLHAGYAPMGNTLPVDLHWDIGAEYKELHPDIAGAWERAENALIAGVDSLCLSAEDLVVHLASHLSFEHLFEAHGMRALVDLAEVCRSGATIDWEKVPHFARQWGNSGGVYLSLLLARELAAAAVPLQTLGKLRPPEFDTSAIGWAVEQIFTDHRPGEERCCSPYFWRLWAETSLGEKAKNLSRLLFPPRERIAQVFPVSTRSRRRYLYYGKRLGRHFMEYGGVTLQIVFRNKAARARAVRENRNLDMRGKLLSR